MNRTVRRFLLWLASIDARSRDLYVLRDFLMQVDAESLESWIRHVKDTLPADAMALGYFDRDAPIDVLSDIEQVLRGEAGLSAAEAGKLISEFLMEEKGSSVVVPYFRSREGLRTYLERLLKVFSERELLSIAHQIRNRYIHSRPSDWRLPLERKE